MKSRVVIIQYLGDYREAYNRLKQGGLETYGYQKYSVDSVVKIAKKCQEITTICLLTEEDYNEVLEPGVRAVGLGYKSFQEIKSLKVTEVLKELCPTHLVLTTPASMKPIVNWCKRQQKPPKIICRFADSFSNQSIKDKIRNYLLANFLNQPIIDWIGNHGINSCASLKEIGVNPDKIIPWDYPHQHSPKDFEPKSLSLHLKNWNLFYVGSVIESKGVGDILDAISILQKKSYSVRLKIAGKGDTQPFINQAQELKISDIICFLGLVPNHTVINLMREADLVIIPSRHEYPEGLPLTIYEALCSRTPIVASDHPMFKNQLKDMIGAMVFPAKNSSALASKIEQIMTNLPLYNQISLASAETWQKLQIPVKHSDLIARWLDDSPESQKWLFEHRLSSGIYSD